MRPSHHRHLRNRRTTVVRDGEKGIIVPTRNCMALSSAMLSIAKDSGLCQSMGDKALKTGAISNTWADYAKGLYNAYIQHHHEL